MPWVYFLLWGDCLFNSVLMVVALLRLVQFCQISSSDSATARRQPVQRWKIPRWQHNPWRLRGGRSCQWCHTSALQAQPNAPFLFIYIYMYTVSTLHFWMYVLKFGKANKINIICIIIIIIRILRLFIQATNVHCDSTVFLALYII